MDRDERLAEIFRRAEDIRCRREARRVKALGGMTAAMSLALAVLVGALADRGAAVRGTVLGATILGPDAGGYVIVALLSFVLGIIVALVSMKRRQAKTEKSDQSGDTGA